MRMNFKDAIKHRRSHYQLKNESPVSDKELRSIIEHVLKHAPSSFNTQSARVVLLLGDDHKRLWDITKDELKKVSISEEAFKQSEEKVNNSFSAGYGTILFFEDQTVIRNIQEAYPLYASQFTKWSEHSSAIVQILTWLGLGDVGLGASLQHYNPLIDEAVKKEWSLNEDWELIAQMPFGTPLAEAGEKTYVPIEERLLVF